jgi:hypothetical protein
MSICTLFIVRPFVLMSNEMFMFFLVLLKIELLVHFLVLVEEVAHIDGDLWP